MTPYCSTGTLTTSAKYKAKHSYDPAKLWGLQPEERQSSTYVISGHVVSGTSNDPRTLQMSENIGREGQAKAKRKLNRDADFQLKKLLERDKNGMQVVISAREAAKKMAAEGAQTASSSSKGKAKERPKGVQDSSVEGESEDDLVVDRPAKTSKGYSAGVIKSLGFDPSLKGGQQKVDSSKLQNKVRDNVATWRRRRLY